MNQGHCSFCDAFPLIGSSKEPIEHFRPKSDPQFRHLAYAWSNLYYSCECCQSHKGERWDDTHELVSPDAADYECFSYFEFDFLTGEMRPNSKASDLKQARAQTTIEHYGLDHQDRRDRRQRVLREWQRLHETQRQIDSESDRDFLEAAPAGGLLASDSLELIGLTAG